MQASILSIGDELILGQRLDTNSRWLSRQLIDRSVQVREHRTVDDDRAAIAASIAALSATNELLLITGGLGPTADDLTREALGDVFAPGAALVRDERRVRRLERWFASGGRTLPPGNLKQADRPASMEFVDNPIGTAPGLTGAIAGCRIFAMPGPPREMQRMFAEAVVAALPAEDAAHWNAIDAVRSYGLGESEAARRLGSLMDRQRGTLVGTTASEGILTARIRCEGARAEAEANVQRARRAVEAAWAPYCFGRGEDMLADDVGRLLTRARHLLATAESCTGGLLGAMIVDVAGASSYYAGGWVTYSNAMKSSELGVPAALIEEHGAVSDPVARAMAEGARGRAASDWGIGITGIAGPDGDGPDKPSGTVHIAVAGADATTHRRFLIRGERSLVRDRAAKAALQMLRFRLLETGDGMPLLWEQTPAAAGGGAAR